MRSLRVGLAQINTTVGDLQGNLRLIQKTARKAAREKVDLLAFPELALTGYPPEDLLCRPQFISDNLACLEQLRQSLSGSMVTVVGFVDRQEDIYNAAAVIQDRKLVGVYHKQTLPNYGVFDENRYFQRSFDNRVFRLGPVVFGVTICEDIWVPAGAVRDQALLGDALLLVNISASPYHADKPRQRWNMLSTRAMDNSAVVAITNLVGGQDELIFDGASAIFSPEGERIASAPLFQEDLLIADIDLEAVLHKRLRDLRRRNERSHLQERKQIEVIETPLPLTAKGTGVKREAARPESPALEEEVYQALVLGTRDYVEKNGFKKVVLGLSGGVDSALTAAIAVDALGADRVVTVGMPSRFSSEETKEDTRKLADNLGVDLIWIPIDDIYQSYLATLGDVLKKHPIGITEENLQSRVRGNLLMALSNFHGWLVLTTGNKSEASVGYCTLYGDMAGGISVIKDCSKMMVYSLCRYRNEKAGSDWIPESILTRAPSAELKPDQKDTDSLPAYEVLDRILYAYIEEERTYKEILELGFEPETVRDVISKVDKNEYKRRQSPPGLKISPRALGKDRRVPITNRYRIFDENLARKKSSKAKRSRKN